ncbi:hypothetical protein KUTeg_022254 [Tegillarca granosa]|uniref:Centrosomin N-terminal motif 1 domain-containing protein n=1 Tax=Tegillarca granosa TaxID=220873 RepID=A0ABQ9EB94_TEGGR|nr:hypothetical protein KUTeg_022254 [Tegillarca granosa]
MICTNLDLLTDVTFGSHLEYPDGSVPMVAKTSSGRMSPVRARTMKEYDQQLAELKKENFSLKLRIYFLEERMQQKFGDGEDVFKTNIELKVEVESLKKDLADKHELLKKASNAMENLSSNHQIEMEKMRGQVNRDLQNEKLNLEKQLQESQEELEKSLLALQHELDDLKKDNSNKDNEIQQLRDEKCQAEECVQKMEKDVNRKDRDLEDVVDDQKEHLIGLQSKVTELGEVLKDKDDMIAKLEDLLRNKENDMKELEQKLVQMSADIDDLKEEKEKSNKIILAMAKTVKEKAREVLDANNREKTKDEELKAELDEKHDEVTFLEAKLTSTQTQLKEREFELEVSIGLILLVIMGVWLESLWEAELWQEELVLDGLEEDCFLYSQNLMKNLGKKEGELEGFKELLSKAESALTESEAAVEKLYEDGQKLLEDKDKMLQQFTQALKDKERQLQQAMEIFQPGLKDDEAKNQMIIKLEERLKEKQRDLDKLDEDKYQQLEEKDDEIRKLKHLLREKERDLERANHMLLKAEESVDAFEKENRDKDKNMRQLSNSLHAAQKSLDDLVSGRSDYNEELSKLKHKLCDKEKLLEFYKQLEDLKIEVAVKSEALRSAKITEDDLRQQLNEWKQKWDSQPHGQKEVHKLEREVIYLKEQLSRQNTPPPSSTQSKADIEKEPNLSDEQIKRTLQEQLQELRKLSSTLQAERQIIYKLKENQIMQDASFSGQSKDLGVELSAVQSLRRELEDGVIRNNQMRAMLEQQVRDAQKTATEYQSGIDNLKKEVNSLKQELASKNHLLDSLRSENLELQCKLCRADGEIKTSPTRNHRNLQTSPLGSPVRGRSENFKDVNTSPISGQNGWPNLNKSPSPVGMDVPLNRQSLSEMSAPMLRKFIRQLQQQLNAAEKEKSDLRTRLSSMDSFRDIPGKNEDDINSIPLLHNEIEKLQKELLVRDRDIKELKSKLGLDLNDNGENSNLSSIVDLQNQVLKLKVKLKNVEELNVLLKRQLNLNTKCENGPGGFDPNLIVQMAEEIQRLKTELNAASNQTDVTKTVVNGGEVGVQTSPQNSGMASVTTHTKPHSVAPGKSHIPRPKHRPTQHLSHTDIRHVENVEFLKSLLTEAKSKIENLEDKLKATEGTVRLQTQKMKYYRGLLEEHGLMARSPVCSRSNSETNLASLGLRAPIRRALSHDNLASVPPPKSALPSGLGTDVLMSVNYRDFGKTNDISELKEQLKQVKDLVQGYQKLVSTLKFKVNKSGSVEDGINGSTMFPDKSLKSPGSSTEKRLSQSSPTHLSIADLQKKVTYLHQQLQETKETNNELQHRLSQQQLSLTTVTELKKQLEESHVTIATLEDRLRAIQGSSTHQVIDSQKQEIGNLRKKLSDSQNACYQLESEDGSDTSIRFSLSITKDRETMLTEELKQKNLEVKKLTEQLKKKNTQVIQLNHELFQYQDKLRQQGGGKLEISDIEGNKQIGIPVRSNSGSSFGSVDGNSTLTQQGHTSPLISNSTMLKLDDTRISRMSDDDKSLERMRHRTGSDDVDNVLPHHLSRSRVEIVEDSVVSSQKSHRISSMSLNGLENQPANVTIDSDSKYVSVFDTDERLYDRHRLADRDLYSDHSFVSADRRSTGTNSRHHLEMIPPGLNFGNVSSSHRESICNLSTLNETQNPDVDLLKSRLLAVEDLNKTLKEELNLYENLFTSVGVQSSPQKSLLRQSSEDIDQNLLQEHLAELRALRLKLEKSLKDSDRLREELEKDMGNRHDPSTSTSNVYIYSQQLSTIQELQQTIQKLRQQLLEKESSCHDNQQTIEKLRTVLIERETIIREHQQTILKMTQEVHDKEEIIREKLKMIDEKERSLIQKTTELKEKDHQSKQNAQSFVIQQRKIEQQEKAMKEMQNEIERTEQAIQDQNQKLKEQCSLIQELEKKIKNQASAMVIHMDQIKKYEKTIKHQAEKIQQFEKSKNEHELKVKQQEKTIKMQDEQVVKQEQTIHRQAKILKEQEGILDKKEDITERLLQKNNKLEENIKKATKEIQRLQEEREHLQEQHNENQDINKTLKLELSVYEKLQSDDQASTHSDEPSSSDHFGLATWPLSTSSCHNDQDFNKQHLYSSHSSPGGTFHRSLLNLDNNTSLSHLHHPPQSDGNLSYHVYDPPGVVADYVATLKVDSDLRNLFAVGKIDDFEKLKRENSESLSVLKGIQARIQERLKVFRTVSPLEIIKIESLRNEVCTLKTKYGLASKMIHDAEERLQSTNLQKQNMEDIIYRQCVKINNGPEA